MQDMNDMKRAAARWIGFAHQARKTAYEKDDDYTQKALQVADLCDHVAAAMERISDIMDSVDTCVCGQCPDVIPSILQ